MGFQVGQRVRVRDNYGWLVRERKRICLGGEEGTVLSAGHFYPKSVEVRLDCDYIEEIISFTASELMVISPLRLLAEEAE